jgi:hypothetical protein
VLSASHVSATAGGRRALARTRTAQRALKAHARRLTLRVPDNKVFGSHGRGLDDAAASLRPTGVRGGGPWSSSPNTGAPVRAHAGSALAVRPGLGNRDVSRLERPAGRGAGLAAAFVWPFGVRANAGESEGVRADAASAAGRPRTASGRLAGLDVRSAPARLAVTSSTRQTTRKI